MREQRPSSYRTRTRERARVYHSLIIRVIRKCAADRLSAFAAQAAFFILMSFFPFLILVLQLMKLAPISQESLLLAVDSIFPEYLLPTLHEILQELYSSSFGLVPVTVAATIWAASKAMHALTQGLDTICNAREIRRWIIVRIWAILYTVVFAILLVAAAGSTVFWKTIRDLLVRYRPPGVSIHLFSAGLKAVYTVCILTLAFMVMYKVFPHKKLRFIDQCPGAVLSAAGWWAFSEIIAVYVTSFNGFSMYGSLTTLTLVMFWLYFCCYFVMVGAEVNEIRRRDREEETGPPPEAFPGEDLWKKKT